MAKKSRHLPGGRIRKPIAPPRHLLAGEAVGTLDDAETPAELSARTVAPLGAVEDAPGGTAVATAVRPARPGGVPVGPASRVPGPARVPSAAATAATGAARPRPAAVRAGAAPAQRSGRSLMDLAAANYAHIRGDLARIAILAVVMLAVIIALSFVLK